jgi:hypothetical protein
VSSNLIARSSLVQRYQSLERRPEGRFLLRLRWRIGHPSTLYALEIKLRVGIGGIWRTRATTHLQPRRRLHGRSYWQDPHKARNSLRATSGDKEPDGLILGDQRSRSAAMYAASPVFLIGHIAQHVARPGGGHGLALRAALEIEPHQSRDRCLGLRGCTDEAYTLLELRERGGVSERRAFAKPRSVAMKRSIIGTISLAGA